ncbi:MAG: RDD family protein [Nocardioidaceae bacterium]
MSAAGPSTPDGVPLASWWSRVGARLLDVIFVSIIGLPVTGYFYYRYFGAYTTWMQQLSADASAGRPQFSFTLPNSVLHWLLVIAVLSIVVGVAYEAYFLRCSGATPGKQIAGISVRLRDTPGPMPMTAIWRRVGVMYGLGVLGDIPVVGVLFAIVNLLNYLWPLWDGKKQAWHDKVASTNVVQGPRAKPPAISPGWG